MRRNLNMQLPPKLLSNSRKSSKGIFSIGLLFLVCYFIATSWSYAQINVTEDIVDPNTRLFSDGKTTVESYINSQLAAKSNCCGDDNLFLQVKLDPSGYSTTVRALSGKNECIKRTAEELVSYIRWKIENPSKITPIVFNIKIKQECTGAKSATSPPVKLGEPDGFAAKKQAAMNNKGGNAPDPNTVVTNNGSNNGTNTGQTDPKVNAPVEPSNNQTQQPRNSDPQIGNRAPLQVSPVDTASARSKMQPVELPDPVYKSMGERKPDSTHIKSYSNEQGPQYETPKFIDGEAGMGVFIKSTYRKMQYCGLVNVMAELTIETDGTVSAYRIFKTNSDKVQSLTPYVVGSMRFQRLPRREYFVLQYQSDVDCEGFPHNAVDKANFYFSAPDKAPRAPKEESQSPNNTDEGDVLKKEKDH